MFRLFLWILFSRLLIGSLSAEQEDLLSSLTGLLPDSTKRVNPMTQAIRDKHLQSDGIEDLMAQEKDDLACLEKEVLVWVVL